MNISLKGMYPQCNRRLSIVFNGFDWVIKMIHPTVGTPTCVQFMKIDGLGIV